MLVEDEVVEVGQDMYGISSMMTLGEYSGPFQAEWVGRGLGVYYPGLGWVSAYRNRQMFGRIGENYPGLSSRVTLEQYKDYSCEFARPPNLGFQVFLPNIGRNYQPSSEQPNTDACNWATWVTWNPEQSLLLNLQVEAYFGGLRNR
jgi:hypothetical protein